MSQLSIPFFFDKNLTKNFKVFGQVLYIYFDPTFRRHVSVIDIGLKQKSSLFVDDLFKYRTFTGDNNFQFYFLKRKDIFSLKPSRFLNSKNEKVLKKKYLSFSKNKFSFLNLNKFSFLSVRYLTDKNENLFKFKNENLFNFILLKNLLLTKMLKNYKLYSLIFLNLLVNSKKSKNKVYSFLTFLLKVNFLINRLKNLYISFAYLSYVHSVYNLNFFLNWLFSLNKTILQSLDSNFASLGLTKLSRLQNKNFSVFDNERDVFSVFKKIKKKINKSRNPLKSKSLMARKSATNSLIENSNLFTIPTLNIRNLNKLEFSINKGFDNSSKLGFGFADSLFHPGSVSVIKNLRTKNYYSILSKGKAFALVNKLSFLNLYSYGGFWRKRLFKNWLKFLIYFEKLNYLLAVNNEEITFNFKFSSHFFFSIFFPLIFNFRNLFFNLLKFFRFFKISHERSLFRNFSFLGVRKSEFNKRFFGTLLNSLLINKEFNKVPKNLLLNSSTLLYKTNFKSLNFASFNGLFTLKFLVTNLFNLFLDQVNYVALNSKPSEKFINDNLIKLSFINFSLGFEFKEFSIIQSSLNKNFKDLQDFSLNWVPLFKIFKSLKIISKYAKKYRRKPNFSKRRKFKYFFRKKNHFLATKGTVFKSQNFFSYPFKSRFLNSNRWSFSANKIHISPKISRYGAYLDRINSLSRKFKSKVRIFPLNVFKNRLSTSFDRIKEDLLRKIYFQRFLSKIGTIGYRTKKPLSYINKDRSIKRWDKNQFYPNPFFKKSTYKSANKNKFKPFPSYNAFRRKPNVRFSPKSIIARERFKFVKKPFNKSKFN